MLKFTKKQLILLYVVSCFFIMILAFRFAISPLMYDNSELRLLKTETAKKSDELKEYPNEIKVSKMLLSNAEETMGNVVSKLLPLMKNNEDIIDCIFAYTEKFSITPTSMTVGDTNNVLSGTVVGVPLLYRTDIDITVIENEEKCLRLVDAISNDSSMLLKEYRLNETAIERPVGNGFTTDAGYTMSLRFSLYMFG